VQHDFSIVIPTLNSEKYLEKTLESIKKQNKSIEIECIFSDGGSFDATLAIINNFYQANITKIILYNQVGMSKALNSGFKVANGKYVSYLNSDDMLAEDALDIVKEKFEVYKKYQWLIGLSENIGKKYVLNKIVTNYKKSLFNLLNFNLLCANNIISQPSVYWKNTFFQNIGYFNEKISYNMDYDMWLRMIKNSPPLKTKKKLSYFRRHNDSLSHKNLIKQFYEKFKTMRKYNKNIIISALHLSLSLFVVFVYKITNY
tara:strand:+ start:157 stop:930 length:774 start_codon:yes stop_codon:yes gene_type:complete